MQNILNDSPCRAGDHSYSFRKLGQLFFKLGIKPPSILEFELKLMKLLQELAYSYVLEMAGNELVLPSWSIKTDLPFYNHMIPLFGRTSEARATASEKNSRNLSILIFKSKIE